jgi:hypothetical protein
MSAADEMISGMYPPLATPSFFFFVVTSAVTYVVQYAGGEELELGEEPLELGEVPGLKARPGRLREVVRSSSCVNLAWCWIWIYLYG